MGAPALRAGRRPPSAGGGHTKYHRLAFRNSLHRIGIRPIIKRYSFQLKLERSAHLGPFVESIQPRHDLLQLMNLLVGRPERLPPVQLFSPSFIGFFQLLQMTSPFSRSLKTPAAAQKSAPPSANRPHPGSLERLPASLKAASLPPGAEAYQSSCAKPETAQKATKPSQALSI
jgi:hypothetical protein